MDSRVAFVLFLLAFVYAVNSFPDHEKSVKITIADTEAKSDSKAEHGMAASSSSTKGNAPFVTKSRRSARFPPKFEIVAADTKAESDSQAMEGTASSSSSTKGNAASVSRHPRSPGLPSEAEIAVADKKAEPEVKKVKTTTPTPYRVRAGYKVHRRSVRSPPENSKIAVADSNGNSDSGAKDGIAFSSSVGDASATFVVKQPYHPHKEDHHDQDDKHHGHDDNKHREIDEHDDHYDHFHHGEEGFKNKGHRQGEKKPTQYLKPSVHHGLDEPESRQDYHKKGVPKYDPLFDLKLLRKMIAHGI